LLLPQGTRCSLARQRLSPFASAHSILALFPILVILISPNPAVVRAHLFRRLRDSGTLPEVSFLIAYSKHLAEQAPS